MPICYHEKSQEFHLYNDEISYVFHILPNGHLGNLYVGKKVSPEQSYIYLTEHEYRALTSFVKDDGQFLSLQYARPEYACYGTTDYFLPAFEVKKDDGSSLSNFVYDCYRISSGKPDLVGLPHLYLNKDEEADSLEIELFDRFSQTRLILTYTIFKHKAVISRQARFVQEGEQPVMLTRALSMNLDLPDADYDWLHLDGAWGRERYVKTSPLHQGCQSIYSLKGSSSAEHNPFIALKRRNTTEHDGEVFGFSLIYSGNFLAQVDVSSFWKARVSMGIHPDRFEWCLRQGDMFQTPEVVMVYSDKGLNGMSQTYHDLYRNHLMRGIWKNKERPILLNNWEAMSFDFDEVKILDLAERAAEVGAELFVMDDGWFGKRNHERAGLGDWQVNQEKLPSGLKGIINQVHQLGMKFGLWIEPEMVNKDSDLFRSHPDWIFQHSGYSQSHGRYQYTLDLSREDVYLNLVKQLGDLLTNHEIDYIKWDMNRYMTEVFSSYYGSEQQGEIFHRYILNLYRLYDYLTTTFPQVLFESCSSGGGRFDPGLLYYAPQTWTSDNSDAIARLSIQYGTSMVYPLVSMGCHVSASPNQQLGRFTPLETRGNVAFFGSFGYELDLSVLNADELAEIKRQIVFYKQYRRIFQFGTFTRLLSPFEHDRTAWQVISEDKKDIFVAYYRSLVTANLGYERLYLKNLDASAFYEWNGVCYAGNQLMYAGLPICNKDHVGKDKDFTSLLIHLKRVE